MGRRTAVGDLTAEPTPNHARVAQLGRAIPL